VNGVDVRPFREVDVPWAEGLIGDAFGGRLQARRGSVVDTLACRGFVAERSADRVGLLTYDTSEHEAEIVYIEATNQFCGVGTALLQALLATVSGPRIWLITTNDNLDALRFYQRRGFAIADVHVGAVTEARRLLKPQIPETGCFGIPIRDEIELEYRR
jgi:ribosomal protein S18 acetylase RimI-like enzyme